MAVQHVSRRGGRRSLRRLCVLAGEALVPVVLCATIFGLGPWTFVTTGLHRLSGGRSAAAQTGRQEVGHRTSSLPRRCLPWDLKERSTIPVNGSQMIDQAASAAMRAYRKGYTRQAVKLRLDYIDGRCFIEQENAENITKKTQPTLKNFTEALWGGKSLVEARVSKVDDDGVMMCYREAPNARQDAAVFMRPTRRAMTSSQMQSFSSEMEDRLLVVMNTEDAQAPWAPHHQGLQFRSNFENDVGVSEQYFLSYYYERKSVFGWRVHYYRSFPQKFEVYFENLKNQLEKLAETDFLLRPWEVQELLEKYEQENGILQIDKVALNVKEKREGPPPISSFAYADAETGDNSSSSEVAPANEEVLQA